MFPAELAATTCVNPPWEALSPGSPSANVEPPESSLSCNYTEEVIPGCLLFPISVMRLLCEKDLNS